MYIDININSIFSNTQLKKHTEEYKNILSRQKTNKEVDKDLRKNLFLQNQNSKRYLKSNLPKQEAQPSK
jgi:hypothetical protein